eukprot:NODE_113_length_18482_cov_1.630746.p11 type:complete len:224 gc:universal NODE_113_length_18482_cov_1.630746:7742-7071(-)
MTIAVQIEHEFLSTSLKTINLGFNLVRGNHKTEMVIKILFILGGPGSGKGTQSDLLKKHFKAQHLSAGDLLRSSKKHRELIDEYIKNGQIVPSHITIELLLDHMTDPLILVDGFPRQIEQAKSFEAQIEKLQASSDKRFEILGVLFLNIENEKVLVERILKRSQNSGRLDDNPEAIKKRLVVYKDQTMPVIDYYKGNVYTVNGDRDVEIVFNDCKTTIEKLFK